MSFTLHQLNIFEAVVDNQSITKAAEELYMTQPAVSIQIKKLQEHFGLPLIEVLGKKLHLTEAGIELYEAQQDIKSRLEELEMCFSEMKGSLRGKLSISVVSTAKYFMPYLMGEFNAIYPNIKLTLKVTDRNTVQEHLDENRFDLCVMTQLPDNKKVVSVPILKNPLVVVAPHDHRLAKKKNLTLKRLAKEPFLIREPGSGTRMVMLRHFKKKKFAPDFVMELGTNEAIKQAVLAGIGISVVSKLSLNLELAAKKLAILDVKQFPLVEEWKVIYPKGKMLTPVAKNFLEFLKERAEELIATR